MIKLSKKKIYIIIIIFVLFELIYMAVQNSEGGNSKKEKMSSNISGNDIKDSQAYELSGNNVEDDISSNKVVSDNEAVSGNEVFSSYEAFDEVYEENIYADIQKALGFIDEDGNEIVFVNYVDENKNDTAYFLDSEINGETFVASGICTQSVSKERKDVSQLSTFNTYNGINVVWTDYTIDDKVDGEKITISVGNAQDIGDIYIMSASGKIYPCERLTKEDAKAYLIVKKSVDIQ